MVRALARIEAHVEKLIIVFIGFLLINVMVFFKEICHAAVVAVRLSRLLRERDYQQWRILTSIGAVGPGVANPFRWIPWIFKDEAHADGELFRLKERARIRFRWILISAVTTISTIMLILLIMLLKGVEKVP